MSYFVGDEVWPHLSRLVRKCRRKRRVAVAYLGADARELLPLRKGDLLIVNATPATARAGAMNPDSLQEFLDAGVEVQSNSQLHAKVFRLGDVTVVGSPNASPTSAQMHEAMTVSHSKTIARQVDEFIDRLEEESHEVTQTLVDGLRIEWEKRPKGRGMPGVSGGVVNAEWPPSDARIFLEHSWAATFTEAQEKTSKATRKRLGSRVGKQALWLATGFLTTRNGAAKYKAGDIIFFLHQPDRKDESVTELWVPEEVLADLVPVPHSQMGILPLRNPLWIEDLPIEEARDPLRASGITQFGPSRQIKSPAMKNALLELFDLPRKPG
jgi:hypothetical protein